jgi:hypothetical protein
MRAPAIDPEVLQQVEQQVQLFKDEASSSQERVLAVMRLHDKVGHLITPGYQVAHSRCLGCLCVVQCNAAAQQQAASDVLSFPMACCKTVLPD